MPAGRRGGVATAAAAIVHGLRAQQARRAGRRRAARATLDPGRNTELAAEQHRARKLVVENLPVLVTVETTSICNLRCVMCPQAIGEVKRPKHLANDLMDRLAGAMRSSRNVQLHGIGEPLASPAFWRAIEQGGFHPDTEIAVNSNLTLLNERRLRLLAETKLRLMINVSLDAATAETYRRIRGADFAGTIENITRLREARGERPHPAIFVNMTLMRENIEEAEQFVELAHRLRVEGVYLWHLNRWPDEVMSRYRIDRDEWHFDYAAQGLWNHKALSNRCIGAALLRGKALGIEVRVDHNKTVLFDEDPDESGRHDA